MRRVHCYKLGGSLLRTGRWLQVMPALLEHSRRMHETPLVMVGGGSLADAVRGLCAQHHASVEAEDEMSLHAMTQNALQVAARYPELKPCHSVEQAWMRVSAHTPGIWVNIANINQVNQHDISNSITSDSLSLTYALAMLRHAEGLTQALTLEVTLLKSCEVPDAIRRDAPTMKALGIVDEAFPLYAQQLDAYAKASWSVANAAELIA